MLLHFLIFCWFINVFCTYEPLDIFLFDWNYLSLKKKSIYTLHVHQLYSQPKCETHQLLLMKLELNSDGINRLIMKLWTIYLFHNCIMHLNKHHQRLERQCSTSPVTWPVTWPPSLFIVPGFLYLFNRLLVDKEVQNPLSNQVHNKSRNKTAECLFLVASVWESQRSTGYLLFFLCIVFLSILSYSVL